MVRAPHCSTHTRGAVLLAVVLSLLAVLIAPGAESQTDQPIATIRKQAKAGDPQAQYQLGRAFAQGEEVPQDKAEAVRWYRKAAEQGHLDAQNKLGVMARTAVTQDTRKLFAGFERRRSKATPTRRTTWVMYHFGEGAKDTPKLSLVSRRLRRPAFAQ